MQMDKRDLQFGNADPSRWQQREHGSNVAVKREQQLEKQCRETVLAVEGMQIDERKGHSRNADSSMDERPEGDSNVSLTRD
jgi:hypothetical protein